MKLIVWISFENIENYLFWPFRLLYIMLKKMTNKILVTEFDYVFMNLGYTDRLMKKRDQTIGGSVNLQEYLKKRFCNSNINLLAIGNFNLSTSKDDWSESEIYCDNETLNFLRTTEISPFGCVVIGGKLGKLTFNDVSSVASALSDLEFCGYLSNEYYSFDPYEFQGNVIAKMYYDTECG
ncbi:putative orfan [Tupanvirus soda lake]|uniref:Orfan n=2 Tax=Tupanvirus TaxID=2094720 RepID=A0AC62AAN0_9VIRU|nr:putative orfan [Tupanvirus soda lake]QKU34794.1 putative orfan [Tupanvirus soda lake]